ncbi:splicing factor 3A subunit 2-like [Saccopteryx leptura]|uniref:splicing factor 3A subunit 2-like n=1 Tax=Saccopteryx leptura TaxID=249018 RepID=UPI00339C092A
MCEYKRRQAQSISNSSTPPHFSRSGELGCTSSQNVSAETEVLPPTQGVLPSTSAVLPPTSSMLPPTPAVLPPTKGVLSPTKGVLSPTSAVLPPTKGVLPPTSAVLPPTPAVLSPTKGVLPPTSAVLPPTSAVLPPTQGVLPPTLSADQADLPASTQVPAKVTTSSSARSPSRSKPGHVTRGQAPRENRARSQPLPQTAR